MNEVLNMPEIHRNFPNEWVLVEDPATTDAMEVLGGRVLWHSSSRDEVYQKALELQPVHSAILFTGVIETELAL